jgi:hypothetical protein
VGSDHKKNDREMRRLSNAECGLWNAESERIDWGTVAGGVGPRQILEVMGKFRKEAALFRLRMAI